VEAMEPTPKSAHFQFGEEQSLSPFHSQEENAVEVVESTPKIGLSEDQALEYQPLASQEITSNPTFFHYSLAINGSSGGYLDNLLTDPLAFLDKIRNSFQTVTNESGIVVIQGSDNADNTSRIDILDDIINVVDEEEDKIDDSFEGDGLIAFLVTAALMPLVPIILIFMSFILFSIMVPLFSMLSVFGFIPALFLGIAPFLSSLEPQT